MMIETGREGKGQKYSSDATFSMHIKSEKLLVKAR